MEAFYLIIIALLLLLTMLNLNTGVSNDAVNFLAPAVGAKAAGYKLVMAIAVAGVFIGAATNNGMQNERIQKAGRRTRERNSRQRMIQRDMGEIER